MSRRLDDTDLQKLLDAAYAGHVHAVDVVRLVEEVKYLKDQQVRPIPTTSYVMEKKPIPCVVDVEEVNVPVYGVGLRAELYRQWKLQQIKAYDDLIASYILGSGLPVEEVPKVTSPLLSSKDEDNTEPTIVESK